MKRFVAYAALFILGLTGQGFGYDSCTVPEDLDLRARDSSKLGNLDISRTRGLGAALRSDSQDDRAVVAGLFDPGTSYVNPALLTGRYRCRTIKLGGLLPLVVYQWFTCEIEKDGSQFTIRKLTGSQNFAGTLVKAGPGFAYKGAGFYGWEGPGRIYGADEEQDQVGCLSAVTKQTDHFILELPFPQVESFHDVIELQKQR